MQMAVDRGLGRHKGSLSAAHLDQYHKVRGHVHDSLNLSDRSACVLRRNPPRYGSRSIKAVNRASHPGVVAEKQYSQNMLRDNWRDRGLDSIRYSGRCLTMRCAQSMGLPWEGKDQVESGVDES